MSDAPQKTFRRTIFFKANRFQKPIIDLILYPAIISSTILFFYILYFQYEVISTFSSPTKNVEAISLKAFFIFGLLVLSFGGIILWAYKVSCNLVGAFERILRELDDILAGKGKRHIRARKEDELANELLKRVNALIDKLP